MGHLNAIILLALTNQAQGHVQEMHSGMPDHLDLDNVTLAHLGNMKLSTHPSRLMEPSPRSRPFLRALPLRARPSPLKLGHSQLVQSGALQRAAMAVKAEKSEPTLQKKVLAEFVGTFLLVNLGCATCCTALYNALAPNIPAIFGLVVALAVYATRDISGAHLNPAVTVSLAANKKFPEKDVMPYVLAQMAGGVAAGAVNYGIWKPAITAFETTNKLVRGTAASTASFAGAFGLVPNLKMLSPFGAFGVEVFFMAILTWLIYAVTDSNNSVPSDLAAPALIGSAITTLLTIMGPLTGGCLNPARDLGPRLVTMMAGWGSAATKHWWLYTAGPVVGAYLGGYAYQKMFPAAEKKSA